MEQVNIVSSYAMRNPKINRCEIRNLRESISSEEVSLHTMLSHTIEALPDDDEYHYAVVNLTAVCRAVSVSNEDDALCNVEYEIGLDLRAKKDSTKENTCLYEMEKIGLSTLLSTARASIRGVLGVLNIEYPFTFPLVDIQKMIEARKKAEAEGNIGNK